DCRVFTATGLTVDRSAQPEIAERVNDWSFTHKSDESLREQQLLRDAAAFLRKHRDQFPKGVLPGYPAAFGAIAIRVFRAFGKARQHAADESAIIATLASELTARDADPKRRCRTRRKARPRRTRGNTPLRG